MFQADADLDKVSPDNLVRLLPTRPLCTSPADGWSGATLQHYQHTSGEVETPPVRDNILVVNLSGETYLEERFPGGGREQRWVDAGKMSITPAGRPISRRFKGRPEILLIHIARALVRDVAEAVHDGDPEKVSLNRRLGVPDRSVDRLGRLLLDEAELQSSGTNLAAEMLVRALVIHLLRHHSNHGSLPPEPAVPRLGGRLRRVLDLMNEHMEEDLSLARLSELSGLSQPQFSRAFREAIGKPPHHYLIDLRVQRAKRLLDETPRSVIEVGMACGFQQPNHFATTFRKLTGMSPRSWRTRRL